MSGSISFRSYLSRGFGANRAEQLTASGPLANADLRVVGTTPTGAETEYSIPRQVQLLRPCSISGVRSAAIRRTEPSWENRNLEFEPNYLASIEFNSPDLPWRVSMDEPAEGRRMPWLALVVLADGEYESIHGGDEQAGVTIARGVHAVRVLDTRILPPVEQAGAWAHVHVNGAIGDVFSDTSALDASSPLAVTSRLLAARRLEPNTSYTAFLVPTYACGRDRGLNPGGEHTHSNGFAWSHPNQSTPGTRTEVILPVYQSWAFATSTMGDIEALIERLTPTIADPLTGSRPMQVSDTQAYGVAIPADASFRYDGAIVASDLPAAPDTPRSTAERLSDVLNYPDRVRAGEQPLSPDALGPPIYGQWHAQRRRVSATSTSSDWLDALNLKVPNRAAAGLGAEVVRRDQEDLVAEAWRQVGDVVEARRRLCAAQFGYLVSKRAYRRNVAPLSDERLLLMTSPVHAQTREPGRATLRSEIEGSGVRGLPKSRHARVLAEPHTLKKLGVAATVETTVGKIADSTSALRPQRPELHDPALAYAHSTPPIEETNDRGFEARVDGDEIRGRFARSVLGAMTSPDRGLLRLRVNDDGVIVGPAPLDVAEAGSEIREAIDPSTSIPARVNRQIDGVKLDSPSALCRAAMPAPEISRPMYEPLRDLDLSLLVPGISEIPSNSTSLLSVNSDFVESYLAGANSEFAAELLWRGYPTDLRGSYFRSFWDYAGESSDITDMTSWSGQLGSNAPEGRVDDPLVLLIRGDVVRRYPSLAIYLAAANHIASYEQH